MILTDTLAERAERELDALERELDAATDEAERKEIRRAMREVVQEQSDRERWEVEGHERGWY